MHKTLYIDIDEEITSIIDRLKKAEAKEVIIVAPKNALLLQSIVNLRLLKKESERRNKKLLIITQDKIGKKLIEKAGILVRARPEKDIYIDSEPEEKKYEPMYAEEASEIKEELQKEEQEREIGTGDYFDQPKEQDLKIPDKNKPPKLKSKLVREENVPPAEFKNISDNEGSAVAEKKDPKTRINMSDIVVNQAKTKRKKPKSGLTSKKPSPEITMSEAESFPQAQTEKEEIGSTKIGHVSMKKAEKFFRGSRRMKKDFERARVGGGAKKYFIILLILFAVFASMAAAYYFLPKATISLDVQNQEKTVSLDLTAGTQINEINSGEKSIPANREQVSKEFSNEFGSTGSEGGGSKAAGRVVIYNEFGAEEQPLVATTRLETEDGKIFRITKSVVIPGVARVGEESKPGAIEVDVIADQAGEQYNIGPSDFKITGFKNDSSRYEKFYAKSAKPMAGGAEGATRVIAAQDISSAKEKMTSLAKKAALEELKKSVPGDRYIFDSAIEIESLNISVSDNPGTEKEKFSCTAKIQASALSIREDDVKKIMRDSLVQSDIDPGGISFEKPVNYILSESNISQNTMKFQAKTDAKISSGIDLENFKSGILGKSAGDAESYAKSFSAVEKVQISFWPFFTNKIPLNGKRVEIIIR